MDLCANYHRLYIVLLYAAMEAMTDYFLFSSVLFDRDIHCACTTSVFQASFRQCVERSCSFTDAGEGVQFFENACAPHVSVGHDGELQSSCTFLAFGSRMSFGVVRERLR